MMDRIKDLWCDTQSQLRSIQERKEDAKKDLEEKLGLNSPTGQKVKKVFSFLIEREWRRSKK